MTSQKDKLEKSHKGDKPDKSIDAFEIFVLRKQIQNSALQKIIEMPLNQINHKRPDKNKKKKD